MIVEKLKEHLADTSEWGIRKIPVVYIKEAIEALESQALRIEVLERVVEPFAKYYMEPINWSPVDSPRPLSRDGALILCGNVKVRGVAFRKAAEVLAKEKPDA